MTRPRRALLFAPGTERRKIEKAAGLEVDGVILDLEDAAAASKKDDARRTTTAALAELDFGSRERIVRINSLASGLAMADLEALLGADVVPDAILVPKVDGAADLEVVEAALEGTEIRLLALVESARGVVELAAIAGATERLVALCFGAEDLQGDLGASRSDVPRALVAIHARAAGLQALDTPYVRLSDEAGLVAHATEARELGYDGKLAIHPAQIGPIEGVWTPSSEEVAAARRLLEEHARHQAEGRGVFELDGKMIDWPMVRAAERVVGRAAPSTD